MVALTGEGGGTGRAAAERCLVLHPDITGPAGSLARDPDARLAEACGLAEAIGLDIVGAEVVRLSRPKPATFIGTGVVERLREQVGLSDDAQDYDPEHRPDDVTADIDVVVMDCQLSPVQQRNLEKAFKIKVIDRTGLILEIFGARARTKEGRLQVDLAQLSYQRGRLVRSWTHLERQRGGAGFMGGPGETQIETDRRLIDQKMVRLRRELAEVKRTRGLHRAARKRVPHPVVALVGYTNAGKSTLFNRLTEASVLAKDQLFATLDPTMRALDLPAGRRIILSDTVGFVSDLPHELVEAFHATLEEVQEADVVVHVRDAAHPDSAAQEADVVAVLQELGLDQDRFEAMIEVLNKIDLMTEAERDIQANRARRGDRLVILASAVTGEGLAGLLSALEERLGADWTWVEARLGHGAGAAIAWLYQHGEVHDRQDDADGCRLRVRLSPADLERFRRLNPTVTVKPIDG